MEFGDRPRMRKSKNLLMRYQPPQSASWNEDKNQKNNNIKNRMHMNSQSFVTPCQRHTAMRKQMQRRYIGPDPTVPHLKYGIFPRRPNRLIPTQAAVPMKNAVPSDRIDPRLMRGPVDYKREEKRPKTPKKAISRKDSKIQIFDTSEPQPPKENEMRQLTISASTHVDIKPHRFSLTMDKTPLNRRVIHAVGPNYYS